MNLSFVSKAIQTTAEDGTFEEKPVENSESGMAGTSITGSGQGLFEQLRKNQEDADAEREEFQQSIMRGTLALDDEDAAHLEQLNRKRQEELARKQQQTSAELASFRAAQAERQHQPERPDNHTTRSFDLIFETKVSASPLEKKFVPNFIKKKRKRMEDGSEANPTNKPAMSNYKQDEHRIAKISETNEPVKDTEQNEGGITSLLAGYSSSDDEKDDADE